MHLSTITHLPRACVHGVPMVAHGHHGRRQREEVEQ